MTHLMSQCLGTPAGKMDPAGRVVPGRAVSLQAVSKSLETRCFTTEHASQQPDIVISWLLQQESEPQPDPVSLSD